MTPYLTLFMINFFVQTSTAAYEPSLSMLQQSHTNNDTLTGGAEVNSYSSGAELNAPTAQTPRSENDQNSAAISTKNNTPNQTHNQYSSKGISSIYGVQPLFLTNTIVIDVNDKQKGRYGKMLDKK